MFKELTVPWDGAEAGSKATVKSIKQKVPPITPGPSLSALSQ